MAFTQKERVELEEVLDLNRPIVSSVMPRWQRKAMQHKGKEASAAPACKEGSATSMCKTPRKGASKACKTPSKTPGKTPKGKKTPRNDRFIPNRAAMDFDVSHFNLVEAAGAGDAAKADSPSKRRLKSALATSMFAAGGHAPADAAGGAGTGAAGADMEAGVGGAVGSAAGAATHRVLAFRDKAPAPREGHTNTLKVLYSQNRGGPAMKARVHQRHIPSAPERILDAPDLLDDYYLNLLDWSCGNVLAVALGQAVYLWNAASGDISELCSLEGEEDYVSSVSWIKEGGGYLAVGTSNSTVQLWDVEKQRQVRSMNGHSARVGAMDWNRHVLSTGSRDGSIVHHDVRVREHNIATLKGHTQEVCGLKWAPDGQYLASGGNDNLLNIWDAASTSGTGRGAAVGGGVGGGGGGGGDEAVTPLHTLTAHCAAVKALAWCPFQRNTLASGGGTADRTIKFWNAQTGAMLNSIDTGSQVCSLAWSKHEKELLSSHGYSQNQLCLWKYPSLVKVKELTGHTARVLHLAPGPDGNTVCSAGADETLRFWNVFGEASKKGGPGGAGGPGRADMAKKMLKSSRGIR